MPTLVVVTQFRCNTCDSVYATLDQALRCEGTGSTDEKPGWIKPTEDTIAPDPTSGKFSDRSWQLRYGPTSDLYAASVMDAYSTLVTHPSGVDMLKRIRKALK